MELMEAHYAFYGQLGEEAYVTAGSTLNCTCGTEPIKIEIKIDHGITAPNGKAVLTCQDCDVDINNIKNFGSCKCEISKYDILPHPTKLSGEEDETGKGKYKCFPILGREWIAQDKDVVTDDNDTDAVAAVTGDAVSYEALKDNEAVQAATKAYAKETVVGDGSYIEFLGGKRENNKMSKYSVTKIIVYEREW